MPCRFSALIVHEQPEALGALAGLLHSDCGGHILGLDSARTADEAMGKLALHSYSLLIVAHCPPALDGRALLERSTTLAPEALRLLLVSDPREAAMLEAQAAARRTVIHMAAGSPDLGRLVTGIGECIQILRLLEARRAVAQLAGAHWLSEPEPMLTSTVSRGSSPVVSWAGQLEAANRQALQALADAIETKDPYTKGHCARVAAYSLMLAREIGYPDEALASLELGAFLHDIGKIGIRDEVLLKPGPLDEDEWQHMREHVVLGGDLVAKLGMLEPVFLAARHHHERWNGSGYPDGLHGAQIPLIGRLVAIADAWDAMATDRPYKEGMAPAECERWLRRTAGSMYDPELVEVFIARRIGDLYSPEYEGVDESADDGAGEGYRAAGLPLDGKTASNL